MLKKFLLSVPLLVQAVAAAPGGNPHHRHLHQHHHAQHNSTENSNIVPRDDDAPGFIAPKAPFLSELPDDFDDDDGWTLGDNNEPDNSSEENEPNLLDARQSGRKNVLYFTNW